MIFVLFYPVVTLLFKFERQLRTRCLHDSALVEHMHEIRLDVVEQTLIVGYDDGGVAVGLQFVDTAGNYAERIDVKTGVGLVKY